MNVILTVVSGPRAGVKGRFSHRTAITIGRSKTTDFHVLDSTMSRVHAVVAHDAGAWYVEDQKSRNGVFVDGLKVDRARIDSGTVIALGQETSIRFEIESDAVGTSSTYAVFPPCAACGKMIDGAGQLVRSPDGRPYHLACRTLDHLIGTDLGEFRISERAQPFGSGFFFRAHQPSLNRTVMLEVFDSPLTARPGFRQALLDEVRRASRFLHPNILQIYAFDDARGMSFVVIEHFKGERLAQVLEQRRFVRIRGAVQVATAIAEALRYAATHDVRPSWISPEPVLVSEEQEAKVKLFDEPRSDGAREPTAREAPYVAPEVLSKAWLGDEASLVYSVGAILYHMLAGIPPFEGKTAQEVLRRAQREAPPALRRVNLKVSPALAQVVEQSLDRDRAKRPPTLADFIERLKQAAAPIR
jgi:hypothetical protein